MIRLTVEVTEEKLDDLVREAVMNGWVRDEPKKSWTLAEKKAEARFIIKRKVHDRMPL